MDHRSGEGGTHLSSMTGLKETNRQQGATKAYNGTLGVHIHHPSGDARDTTVNLGTSAPQHILGLGRVASIERTNERLTSQARDARCLSRIRLLATATQPFKRDSSRPRCVQLPSPTTTPRPGNNTTAPQHNTKPRNAITHLLKLICPFGPVRTVTLDVPVEPVVLGAGLGLGLSGRSRRVSRALMAEGTP